jgi:hypothetical protein
VSVYGSEARIVSFDEFCRQKELDGRGMWTERSFAVKGSVQQIRLVDNSHKIIFNLKSPGVLKND